MQIGVPDVLWTLFTVPKEACPVVHLERELPRMVATPAFQPWQTCGGVVARPGLWVKTFRHEAVGGVRMTSQSLSIDGMPEPWIVVCTPEDEQTRERVARGSRRDHPEVEQRESRPLKRAGFSSPICGAKEN
ncbi:hypothetical protein [Streptomyces sp. NPDC021562]|uniref:hypothetical protein n=1 Tax=Streptomyces sp. NPDC021562 TaxID=3155121 RepID=UPI0033E6F1BA